MNVLICRCQPLRFAVQSYFCKWARERIGSAGLKYLMLGCLARQCRFQWKSRKGATKCDMHCELQNSVSQWVLDRASRSWDIPEGMPASVSLSNMRCLPVCSSSCSSSASCLCALAFCLMHGSLTGETAISQHAWRCVVAQCCVMLLSPNYNGMYTCKT